MRAKWVGENIGHYKIIEAEPGNVGRGAANYHYDLLICKRWTWNKETMTLTPRYRAEGPRGICHWNLTNGEFIIHRDSTAKPNGDSPAEARGE